MYCPEMRCGKPFFGCGAAMHATWQGGAAPREAREAWGAQPHRTPAPDADSCAHPGATPIPPRCVAPTFLFMSSFTLGSPSFPRSFPLCSCWIVMCILFGSKAWVVQCVYNSLHNLHHPLLWCRSASLCEHSNTGTPAHTPPDEPNAEVQPSRHCFTLCPDKCLVVVSHPPASSLLKGHLQSHNCGITVCNILACVFIAACQGWRLLWQAADLSVKPIVLNTTIETIQVPCSLHDPLHWLCCVAPCMLRTSQCSWLNVLSYFAHYSVMA